MLRWAKRLGWLLDRLCVAYWIGFLFFWARGLSRQAETAQPRASRSLLKQAPLAPLMDTQPVQPLQNTFLWNLEMSLRNTHNNIFPFSRNRNTLRNWVITWRFARAWRCWKACNLNFSTAALAGQRLTHLRCIFCINAANTRNLVLSARITWIGMITMPSVDFESVAWNRDFVPAHGVAFFSGPE